LELIYIKDFIVGPEANNIPLCENLQQRRPKLALKLLKLENSYFDVKC
jgi:hypothetical protein